MASILGPSDLRLSRDRQTDSRLEDGLKQTSDTNRESHPTSERPRHIYHGRQTALDWQVSKVH